MPIFPSIDVKLAKIAAKKAYKNHFFDVFNVFAHVIGSSEPFLKIAEPFTCSL